jgi:hypothetical protein
LLASTKNNIYLQKNECTIYSTGTSYQRDRTTNIINNVKTLFNSCACVQIS